MGNACSNCSKRAKTNSDEDPDNWEEHPEVVAAKEDQKKKKIKRKKKKKAKTKYEPDDNANPVHSMTGDREPVEVETYMNGELPGDPEGTSHNIHVAVVSYDGSAENPALISENETTNDLDENSDGLKIELPGNSPKKSVKSDGSFVNEVFQNDDGEVLSAGDDKSNKNFVSNNFPHADSGLLETVSHCSSSPTSPTRSEISLSVTKRVLEKEKKTPEGNIKLKQEYLEVSDMGTQLSPSAGIYATQALEGPGLQLPNTDSTFPFRPIPGKKWNRFKKSRDKRRRSSSNTVNVSDENSYPFKTMSSDKNAIISDPAPNDISCMTVKFVTKGMRIPVYVMNDEIPSDDRDTSKMTMTYPYAEDDEDEGIEASEFTDVS